MQTSKRALVRVQAAALLLPCLLAGCSVKVDKDKGGEDNNNVSIHTPFGGVDVHQNATTPQDVGLPPYPGATAVVDKDNGGSVDIHLGFGDWQLSVRGAEFQTGDPESKVLAFYRQALGRYGAVVECRGAVAVGKPVTTQDGLGCDDKEAHGKANHFYDDFDNHDLRAGSKRHQHIVGFSSSGKGATRFGMMELLLPRGLVQGDKAE